MWRRAVHGSTGDARPRRARILELDRLIALRSGGIFQQYRGTPIGDLFEYPNLNRLFEGYGLLVGMCMGHRKHLHIPENFACTIRAGGADLRYSELEVSHARVVTGARAIARIGRSSCGMVDLVVRREHSVRGPVEDAGWDRGIAEPHFMHSRPCSSSATRSTPC